MTFHPSTPGLCEPNFDGRLVPPPHGDVDPMVRLLWACRRLDSIQRADLMLENMRARDVDPLGQDDLTDKQAVVRSAQVAAERVFGELVAAVQKANGRAKRDAKAVEQAIAAGSVGRYVVQHDKIRSRSGANVRNDKITMAVVEMLTREPHATQARMSEALACPKDVIRRKLKRLVEAGLIIDTRQEVRANDDLSGDAGPPT